jgi:hypothetical protein
MTTVQEIAKFLLGAGIGANLGDEDEERVVGALIGAGVSLLAARLISRRLGRILGQHLPGIRLDRLQPLPTLRQLLGNECGVVDLFGNRVPEASITPGPETGRWDMTGKGETWQLCPRCLYVSISRACVVCKVCSSGKDRKRVRTLRALARQTPAPSGCSQSENLPMPYKDPTVQRRYQTQWRAAKRQPPPQERPQIWTGQTLTWQ